MYNTKVGFEWDPRKASENFRKHGVRFSVDAEEVFRDDFAVTIEDAGRDPDEQRFVTIGMGARKRVLVVVYCYRGDAIRIIPVRPSEQYEREMYEEKR